MENVLGEFEEIDHEGKRGYRNVLAVLLLIYIWSTVLVNSPLMNIAYWTRIIAMGLIAVFYYLRFYNKQERDYVDSIKLTLVLIWFLINPAHWLSFYNYPELANVLQFAQQISVVLLIIFYVPKYRNIFKLKQVVWFIVAFLIFAMAHTSKDPNFIMIYISFGIICIWIIKYFLREPYVKKITSE